jgi:UDP-N-acetylmuramoyl-L-alanyl-D-glutamate--2,6-diaminopimelate ligase
VKLLNEILSGITIGHSTGNLSVSIEAIEFDSRKVSKGCLFVATPGTKTDGHQFISMAIEKGAHAIVCEVAPEKTPADVACITVKDSLEALGILASNFYDNPSSKMKLVGVTGTNGKTTTATLLYRMFMQLGHKSGLLSTVINYVDEKAVEATHTTPDSVQINKLMNDMVQAGCEYCFMEVSSHSIVQQRIKGLSFCGGIFTNITHDHLDYHKTFPEYVKAKKLFFDNLPKNAFALTNSDDRNGMVMLQNTKATKYRYALKSASEFHCRIIESHFGGMELDIDGKEVWTHFIGEFNAYNLLAVYSVVLLLGISKEETLTQLSSMVPVNGRFDCIRSSNGITAIVDYAHTPDALLNVLKTINDIRKGNEQIIAVVGAGGDRDKTKRPIMAKVSAELSDKVILTSDNPRSEEPTDILNDMQQGIELKYSRKVLTIVDRREAIKTAVFMANPGDIILLAGKGHETYQDIKGVKHHFDDKEEVVKLFAKIGE